MMHWDWCNLSIKISKEKVNFANFKTVDKVDLTEATVYVLGRYHCEKHWQVGEAFTITVINQTNDKEVTVEVFKLLYENKIQHTKTLEFVKF